ncbi:phage antirepressor KilAC domain-containing protein [Parabacteroides goldsteinii]|uniref:phage antirepressor KilAC domain-containing protein n=1 Tax=Parabacteroides goldsteinii TaxID=328812 RepID=UPI0032BF3D2B
MNTVIYDYKGSQISFSNEKNVMVNLTEVAKAFPEKNLTQIINSQEIKDYCDALTKLQNYSLADLLEVRRGGINPGTWAHQKVALRVAQKLSPDFAIWVDTRLEELLTSGVTTISNDDEAILHAMTVLQQRVEENKQRLSKITAEKEQLRLTSVAQEEQLKTQAPQVEYFRKVIDSTGLQTVNMIASCFGISPIKLNKLLCQWGIQYKQSGTYFLYAKYRDKGYAEHKPYPYIDSKGETKTRQHMFWTEKGKQFIIELYTDKAKAERARKALNEQKLEQSKEREAIR